MASSIKAQIAIVNPSSIQVEGLLGGRGDAILSFCPVYNNGCLSLCQTRATLTVASPSPIDFHQMSGRFFNLPTPSRDGIVGLFELKDSIDIETDLDSLTESDFAFEVLELPLIDWLENIVFIDKDRHDTHVRFLQTILFGSPMEKLFAFSCLIKAPAGLISLRDVEEKPQKGKPPQSFVYLISDTKRTKVKIGFSTDPESRLKSLQTGSADSLEMVSKREGDIKMERSLHKRFAHLRLSGEWFSWHNDIIDSFKR